MRTRRVPRRRNRVACCETPRMSGARMRAPRYGATCDRQLSCVAVYGLWHLGCVTAACLAAAGNDVVGLDPDADVVRRPQRGQAAAARAGPGRAGRARGRGAAGCRSRPTPRRRCADADVLWVTFDTPVDERRRGRRRRSSARGSTRIADRIRPRHARADLVAGAGRLHARRWSGDWARPRRCASPARRRTCGSARRSRSSATPSASSSGVSDERRPRIASARCSRRSRDADRVDVASSRRR